jgi:hypothetical protein
MIGLLVVGIGLYVWLKKPRRKRRKKRSKEMLAREGLKALDFNDTKRAVYDFSEHMQTLLPQSHQAAFEKLLERLEIYKYKKNIPPLSQEDKEAMQKMIKEVTDV